MQADKDRQKRTQAEMLDARLRVLKVNEENLRIATESRIAAEKIVRDLEENRLKKCLPPLRSHLCSLNINVVVCIQHFNL